MYSSGQASITKIGPANYRAGRKRLPPRRRPKTEDYSTRGCCNAFLTQRIPLIASDRVTRDAEVKNFNYVNKVNYEYLLDSARRYAGLLGRSINHHPEDSPGAGIISAYKQLIEIVGDEIDINIQAQGSRLEFVLWDRYDWGERSLYWIPLKFMEKLPPLLKKLAISFFHQFRSSMRFDTPIDSDEIDWVMEWQAEMLGEEPEDKETKENLKDLQNYHRGGRIYKFMERIRERNYYKDLHRALGGYEPATDYERDLVAIMQEGMKFIGDDVPTIFSYAYDEHRDGDDYEECVRLDQRFMLTYTNDDYVMNGFTDYLNDIAGNYYEIFPCATLILSPDTDEVLTKDAFPSELFRYLDKLLDFIHENRHEHLQ